MGIWVGMGVLVHRPKIDAAELTWVMDYARRFIASSRSLEAGSLRDLEDAGVGPAERVRVGEGSFAARSTLAGHALTLHTWTGSSLLGISLNDPELRFSGAGGFWDDPHEPGCKPDHGLAVELSQRGENRAWLYWHSEWEDESDDPPSGALLYERGKVSWSDTSERADARMAHAFGADLQDFWSSGPEAGLTQVAVALSEDISPSQVEVLEAARASSEPRALRLECFAEGFPEEVGAPPPPPPPTEAQLASVSGGKNDAAYLGAFFVLSLVGIVVIMLLVAS